MKRILFSLLFAALIVPASAFAQADIEFSVNVAPPALPVYEQPPLPGDGYIWTPGYWAWGEDIGDYYWVPGTWVIAPQAGFLWTPGYWGWGNGYYRWHRGYWGSHIGYYGGVNYGFGYTGIGYLGGRWDHGAFLYNRSVNNIGGAPSAHVYNQRVSRVNASHVSYNGGAGGIQTRPTKEEERAADTPHIAPTSLQTRHEQMARSNPELRATVNHGAPAIAATSRPTAFSGANVVSAKPGSPQSVNRPTGGNEQHSQPQQLGAPYGQPGRQETPRTQDFPPPHAPHSPPTLPTVQQSQPSPQPVPHPQQIRPETPRAQEYMPPRQPTQQPQALQPAAHPAPQEIHPQPQPQSHPQPQPQPQSQPPHQGTSHENHEHDGHEEERHDR